MAPSHYTQIVLNERPVADIQPNTFRSETLPFDLKPAHGQILVQVTWLSLDPAMRGWIRDAKSYMPPVQIGEKMRAQGLAVVLQAGKGSKFTAGDFVKGNWGWTDYCVMDDGGVEKIIVPKGAQALDFINTLGFPGLTAYFGLADVGKLKAGETLLVSGAAGAVGSLVCQLGKKAGARVIAIAGSEEKCNWLKGELGVDVALNHKSPTFKADFEAINAVDVFFDNVGGEILDLTLTKLNRGGRVALCGAISGYNDVNTRGIQNYTALISKRAKIEGFLIFDYASGFPAAIKELSKGLLDGTIKRKFHIVEGLQAAPKALSWLFNGENTGKLVVKVSDVVVEDRSLSGV